MVTQLAYDSQGDLTSKSTPDGNDGSSAGTLSTFAGATTSAVPGTLVSQQAVQVATATVGGVSYAYVADNLNSVIRRINLSTGTESVVAGDYMWRYDGDGGPATTAELGGPSGVAVDSAGDIVIADTGNNVVRFVPATSGTYYGQAMTAGDIYTIAGNDTAGYSRRRRCRHQRRAVRAPSRRDRRRAASPSPTPTTTWCASCRRPRAPTSASP